jgi:hypothetical protein
MPGPLLVGGIMAGGADAWGAAGGGAWWEGAAAGAAAVCAGREGCDWAGTEGRETPVRRDTGITIEEFETHASIELKILFTSGVAGKAAAWRRSACRGGTAAAATMMMLGPTDY